MTIIKAALTDFYLKLSQKSSVICKQSDQESAVHHATQVFAFQTRIEELLVAIDCEIDVPQDNLCIHQVPESI
ncbi:MAG: hypothetical protein WCP39_07900 [Chlamydiota bacterium]